MIRRLFRMWLLGLIEDGLIKGKSKGNYNSNFIKKKNRDIDYIEFSKEN